jgi:hypothetical protein
MRTLALLAALTTVAMAFAGCSDGGGDGDSSTTSSSASGTASATGSSTSRSATSTGSATSTSSGSTPQNRAPAGSISVAVNGTNATFTLTGSDPDGDTIVWDLAYGDGNGTNATSLPANVTHAYPSTGNFTANFTITDGASPVTYDVVLNVTGGAGGTLAVFSEAQATPSNPGNSATVPVANAYLLGAGGCASFNAEMSGGDCVFFVLLPEYAGHAFTATADAGDPDLEFWANCDPSELFGVGGFVNDGPEAGTIPDGAGCVILWAKLPPDVPTHTFTVL